MTSIECADCWDYMPNTWLKQNGWMLLRSSIKQGSAPSHVQSMANFRLELTDRRKYSVLPIQQAIDVPNFAAKVLQVCCSHVLSCNWVFINLKLRSVFLLGTKCLYLVVIKTTWTTNFEILDFYMIWLWVSFSNLNTAATKKKCERFCLSMAQIQE